MKEVDVNQSTIVHRDPKPVNVNPEDALRARAREVRARILRGEPLASSDLCLVMHALDLYGDKRVGS